MHLGSGSRGQTHIYIDTRDALGSGSRGQTHIYIDTRDALGSGSRGQTNIYIDTRDAFRIWFKGVDTYIHRYQGCIRI